MQRIPNKSLLLGLALLLVVPVGSGVAPASDVQTDAIHASPSATRGDGGEASWLIVMDHLPWGHAAPQDAMDMNAMTYDVVSSGQLGSTDLTTYRGVLVPSVQGRSFYQNLNVHTDAIASYVTGGGLLVVHAAQGPLTGAVTDFLPGCAQYRNAPSDTARIVDDESVIVAGVTDFDLQGWGYTTHGFLADLPMVSSTIIEDGEANPIYVTYPWGAGSVFVTAMALEWVFWHGVPRSLLMHNEVKLDPEAQADLVGGVLNLLTSAC